jgi:hypothetical protein
MRLVVNGADVNEVDDRHAKTPLQGAFTLSWEG